jgi:hypothetical protein
MASSENKFTPAPWEVKEIPQLGQFFVAAATTEDHPYHGSTRFIDILSDEDYPRKRADAALVSAAPELLKSVESLLYFAIHAKTGSGDSPNTATVTAQIIEDAKAAIIKARTVSEPPKEEENGLENALNNL